MKKKSWAKCRRLHLPGGLQAAGGGKMLVFRNMAKIAKMSHYQGQGGHNIAKMARLKWLFERHWETLASVE